ncbi:hypothetical protein ACLESO_43640 [Pyxidicoccus sp. 3LG]
MAIHATRLDLSGELSRVEFFPASAPAASRADAAGREEASGTGWGSMPVLEPASAPVIPSAHLPEARPTGIAPADSRVGPGGYSSYSSVSLTTTLY